MKIKNINGLSSDALERKVAEGGRFVYFGFSISLVVVTLKRTSGVYLVHASENAVTKGIPFTILSFLFGWWGIPYGPKYTIQSISSNLAGGKDVTDEVMSTIAGYKLFRETQLKQAHQH